MTVVGQINSSFWNGRAPRPATNFRLARTLGLFLMLVGIVTSRPAISDTWRGTAPFCSGKCLQGETEIERNKSGDGGLCWSGQKVLCRNTAELCVVRETRSSCAGVVLICDNGAFKIPDVWTSCGKFACGVCFGF